jgi:hypothetical protein
MENKEETQKMFGTVSERNGKALALAYLTSRAVMDRLDQVVGPENWQDEYIPGPAGGVVCRLSLRVLGEWIPKQDGADNTKIESVKGGIADALKRAGVKWGIGRYLYGLPTTWHPAEQKGKNWYLKGEPTLSAEFLPAGAKIQRSNIVATEANVEDPQNWGPSQPEQTNGGTATTATDAITQFWAKVRESDTTMSSAKSYISAAGGEFAVALGLMENETARSK